MLRTDKNIEIDKESMLQDVIRVSKLHPSRIHNVYVFGSRVYQTHRENSDWDIIMVANNSVSNSEIKHPIYNLHILTPDKFQEDLNWHRPNALECHFAPEWATLKEDLEFDFKLDLPKLRHATSHVNSNSWVKCKKKLQQSDYDLGIKSLFHAIRIPIFSTQIAVHGRIVDFGCANFLWEELNAREWTWEDLDKEYRTLNNETMSIFRKVASKE